MSLVWNNISNDDIFGENLNDRLGHSVAINKFGNIIVTGSIEYISGADTGIVYVYKQNDITGVWEQYGNSIVGDNVNDRFGQVVDINHEGNRIIVGTQVYPELANNGLVRVYQYNDGNQTWELLGSEFVGGNNDRLGASVSINAEGNRIAFGVRLFDTPTTNAGICRVYQFDGSDWILMGDDIINQTPAAGDNLGFSVSLDNTGERVAVGIRNDDNNGNNSGSVIIFEYDGIAWVQLGQTLNGNAAGDRLGQMVKLCGEGDIVIAGVNTSNTITSYCKVFEFDGNNWVQLGSDIQSGINGDRFGFSFDISENGSRVLIGSFGRNGTGNGIVELYELNVNTWVLSTATITGEANTGYAVGLTPNGQYAVVSFRNGELPGGNPNSVNNQGIVRVFEFSGGPVPCLTNTCDILTPKGYVNITKLKKGDYVLTDKNKLKKITQIKTFNSNRKGLFIPKNVINNKLPNKNIIISENHAINISDKWYYPTFFKFKTIDVPNNLYYHIKLEDYLNDNLIVNGMIMESWDGFTNPNEPRNYRWALQPDNSMIRKSTRISIKNKK